MESSIADSRADMVLVYKTEDLGLEPWACLGLNPGSAGDILMITVSIANSTISFHQFKFID